MEIEKKSDEKFIRVIEMYKKRTEKECYKIECIKDVIPDILDDKIGGKPYLPRGEKIPLDELGKPMGLVIQINLKEIKLKDFPQKGFLEIFCAESFDYPLDYKIKYFKEQDEYETDLPENNTKDFIVEKPIKIKLTKIKSHMPLSDYRAINTLIKIVNEIYKCDINDEKDIDELLGDDWRDSLIEYLTIPEANLDGYADFTQEDPRDDSSYENECLLKIDSNLNRNLHIGDCGILFSFINRNDIKSCQFEKGKLDFDCC